MEKVKYLIVGGGMTADAAVRGIREKDPEGSIHLFSIEADPPYDRPPLSKGLWKDKSVDSIWRNTATEKVQLHLGRAITEVHPEQKQAVDGTGAVYSWEKLLLATGGNPRRLGFKDERVIYYRTYADYQRLRALADKSSRFAVIGAGFIGSEIAASLAQNGKQVTLIFPGPGIGSRVYPQDLSRFLSKYYSEHGVQLQPESKVEAIERRGEDLFLKTTRQAEIIADGIVAGIGLEPNVALARQTGLKTEDGVLVDEFLRTSNPGIYAAGDVANFYNPALGKRLRVEHEDNANSMGQIAGRNMAGAAETYHHLPMFYSDLFDFGYEAVGEIDARLETFSDWKEPFREGVVYYLREDRVRGVLLWNVWGKVDAARALIAEPGPFSSANLKGRLS